MNKNRKPVIAGNWKMNLTVDEAIDFLYCINENLPAPQDVQAIIFPQFPALNYLLKSKDSALFVGAQNMHYLDNGAYTGEVSPLMLKNLGITHVLIGHSERRQYYNESNQTVNLKVISAIKHDLVPILCVGEKLSARTNNSTNIVLAHQIKQAFQNISPEDVPKVIIAYEPIWAIGTGVTATKEQANETIKDLRNMIKKLYNVKVSESIRILYGGSVNSANIKELLTMSDIDGALVGGASLKSESFNYLLKVTKELVG
ncbi:MAG: triose-phosphate isomerase [Acholeplasmatales bacterium]|jgi:triosephosphate isomerase|nr:triose-phosphate isomerase [Acholeplasmatales bacterium]